MRPVEQKNTEEIHEWYKIKFSCLKIPFSSFENFKAIYHKKGQGRLAYDLYLFVKRCRKSKNKFDISCYLGVINKILITQLSIVKFKSENLLARPGKT